MKINVSLDLYKIYCVVVKAGNMSLAAKELYISQPAVSMAIKQLEEEMGSVLFIRTSKGVRTTREGDVLYKYLEQAMGLIKMAEEKYFELVNLEAGELRIGASDTIISNYLMPYLEQFHLLYPEIIIKVTNKTTYESLKLLRSGAVDICFINLPIVDDDDLEINTCLRVNDCLVGGDKFKELSISGIEIQDIEKYPLLMLEDLSNSRRYIDEYAKSNGVVLQPILELGSSDLLVDFARINLGLTFVIKEFTKRQLSDNMLVEIPVIPRIPSRYVGRVKLKNVTFSYAAKRFIELM